MGDALPWERPLGCQIIDHERAEFRVWAPSAPDLTLWVNGRGVALRDAGHGVYEAIAPAQPGDDYFYEIGGVKLPDPC